MGKHKGPKDKKDKKIKKNKTATAEEEAETAAQIKEIEGRLQDINHEMNMIDAKIKRYNIDSKRAELTNRELERLDNDMPIYRQVGRMWLKQNKVTLVENLKGMTALKTVEAQQMRNLRMKLEDRARQEADGIKELIGVDRFKDLFSAASQAKEDPSKVYAEMNSNKDELMMPLFGKSKIEGGKADKMEAIKEDETSAPTPEQKPETA